MRYEDPAALPHDDALAIFAGDDVDLIELTIVGAALHDPDGEWVEEQCWQLSAHADPRVRGAAGLCLGHLARRFGSVRHESWTIVRELCEDPDVDNRPCDGLDDLRMFAGPEQAGQS